MKDPYRFLYFHYTPPHQLKKYKSLRNTSPQRARDGLRKDTRAAVEVAFDELLVPDVSCIEQVGGGGIRCMVAGVHLRPK